MTGRREGPSTPPATPAPPPAPAPASAPESPPTVADAVGGVRGVIESVLPTAVFLVAVTASASVRTAAILAVAAAVLLGLARALARLPLGPAVTGAVLAVLSAVVALRSGSATGFYSIGLLLNVVYAVALAASTLPLPRAGRFSGGSVPLLGVVVATASSQWSRGWSWRADPVRRRLATRLTWMWTALFVVRLAVEVPLYHAGAATALGIARLALGLPPFALLVWVTWAAVRAQVPTQPPGRGAHAVVTDPPE